MESKGKEMNIKRVISVLTCMAAALGSAGCGNASGGDSGKLKVICTGFAEYDWTRSIIGDNAGDVELSYLLDSGGDLHNYQPTAADIVEIADCDVFIYVGGESEAWVNDALKEATNKDMMVVKLLDVTGGKEEELKEGMQAEEEEEEEGEEEGPEYDEHIWLSLENARLCCTEISSVLCDKDPDNAEGYKDNAAKYDAELSRLSAEYADAVNGAAKRTLIFGDRFPFRYLCDDYGIDYYAAFVGCSAETEASFETIVFLAQKTDELGLRYILTIENSDGRIAQSIIENTTDKNQKTAVLDSLQSVTADQAENGTTYLTSMRENLSVIKEALN